MDRTDSIQRLHPPDPRKHPMETRLGSRKIVVGAVLDTTELMENVLKYVDIQALLNSRLVCKLWYFVIANSPSLKLQMQFWSPDTEPAWILDAELGTLQTYQNGDEELHDSSWYGRQGVCCPALLNTLFLQRDPVSVAGTIDVRTRFRRAETLTFVKEPDLCKCANQLWRKAPHMLMTHPPTDQIITYLAYTVHDESDHSIFTKHDQRITVESDESGITLRYYLRSLFHALTPLHQEAVKKHLLKIDIKNSKVWAIGVVFYNHSEWLAVNSGKEAVPYDMTPFA